MTPSEVSCLTTSNCVAVGWDSADAGVASLWTGTSWSSPAIATTAGHLDFMSCVGTDYCMALGYTVMNGTQTSPFTVQWNGSHWSTAQPFPYDTGTFLDAVSCASPSFCMAVGLGGQAAEWNGTSWGPAVIIDPGGEMPSISCPTATFCVTGDDNLGHAEIWNGTSWSIWTDVQAPHGDPPFIVGGVACPTADFCALVNTAGDAATWQLGAGLTDGTHTPAFTPLEAVSCASATSCTSGGIANELAVFDSGTWIVSTIANMPDGPFSLASISCPAAGFCAAVTYGGDIAYEEAGSWTSVTP